MFRDILKTHIQMNHKNVPSAHTIFALFKCLLKKKYFDYAHLPYDLKNIKCLLKGEDCIPTSDKYLL